MILPGNFVSSFVVWILKLLGLDFDLPDERVIEPLDEREVTEQLEYGRD